MQLAFLWDTLKVFQVARQACTLTAIERFAIERSDAKSLARFARWVFGVSPEKTYTEVTMT